MDHRDFRSAAALPVLALAMGIGALLLVIRSGFTVLDYPYYFPDSYDWLVNGLRYSSVVDGSFAISHRALLLPLLVAGAFNYGFEDLLPFVGTVFHAVTALLLYYFFSRDLRLPREATLAALLYVLSFTTLGQSAYFGADVAAHFFLCAAAFAYYRYLTGARSLDLFLLAFFLAIGIHIQYIEIILMPAMFAALFIVECDGRLCFSFERVYRLLRSPAFYGALALGLLIVFLPLIPRLMTFGVLYEERVQHGSLVRLHAGGIPYYLKGLLASFSWPLCLLALFGLARAWHRGPRFLTIFLLLWFFDIFGFFALLYSWHDIRLLLYLALPVFFFAAYGFVALSAALHPITALVVAAGTLYFVHAPATGDPWDLSTALTPWHTMQLGDDGPNAPAWRIERRTALPYLLTHYADTVVRRRQIATDNELDEIGLSAPLIELFKALRKTPAGAQNLVYFERLTPPAAYVIRNRNILYARAPVELVTASANLETRLGAADAVLVTRTVFRRQLADDFAIDQFPCVLLVAAGHYEACAVSQRDFRGALQSRRGLRADVDRVEAAEFPEKLLNGISDQGDDYAAAPLGTPITLLFKTPLLRSRVRIHLWDFDDRGYRFSVETRETDKTWTAIAPPSPELQRGTVTLALPARPIDALRIIGTENSDTARNPGNKILHLKEIELLP